MNLPWDKTAPKIISLLLPNKITYQQLWWFVFSMNIVNFWINWKTYLNHVFWSPGLNWPVVVNIQNSASQKCAFWKSVSLTKYILIQLMCHDHSTEIIMSFISNFTINLPRNPLIFTNPLNHNSISRSWLSEKKMQIISLYAIACG